MAAARLELPFFPVMIRRFLYDQLYPDSQIPSSDLSVAAYPQFHGQISIFCNATVTFHSPSDISSITGMCREYIRAAPSWRGGPARYDTVFINTGPGFTGLRGLEIARIMAFFSFVHDGKRYQSALIHWFACVGTEPDEGTGLWVVEPHFNNNNDPHLAIIHIESIYRAAHLIPVYRSARPISRSLTMHDSLNVFQQFYVNKFVDYHAFNIART